MNEISISRTVWYFEYRSFQFFQRYPKGNCVFYLKYLKRKNREKARQDHWKKFYFSFYLYNSTRSCVIFMKKKKKYWIKKSDFRQKRNSWPRVYFSYLFRRREFKCLLFLFLQIMFGNSNTHFTNVYFTSVLILELNSTQTQYKTKINTLSVEKKWLKMILWRFNFQLCSNIPSSWKYFTFIIFL